MSENDLAPFYGKSCFHLLGASYYFHITAWLFSRPLIDLRSSGILSCSSSSPSLPPPPFIYHPTPSASEDNKDNDLSRYLGYLVQILCVRTYVFVCLYICIYVCVRCVTVCVVCVTVCACGLIIRQCANLETFPIQLWFVDYRRFTKEKKKKGGESERVLGGGEVSTVISSTVSRTAVRQTREND